MRRSEESLLSGPLRPAKVVPVRIPSLGQIDQIDLFKNYVFNRRGCKKKPIKKQLHKKCKYECTINMIL